VVCRSGSVAVVDVLLIRLEFSVGKSNVQRFLFANFGFDLSIQKMSVHDHSKSGKAFIKSLLHLC
jgi:hypothetical protein